MGARGGQGSKGTQRINPTKLAFRLRVLQVSSPSRRIYFLVKGRDWVACCNEVHCNGIDQDLTSCGTAVFCFGCCRGTVTSFCLHSICHKGIKWRWGNWCRKVGNVITWCFSEDGTSALFHPSVSLYSHRFSIIHVWNFYQLKLERGLTKRLSKQVQEYVLQIYCWWMFYCV